MSQSLRHRTKASSRLTGRCLSVYRTLLQYYKGDLLVRWKKAENRMDKIVSVFSAFSFSQLEYIENITLYTTRV